MSFLLDAGVLLIIGLLVRWLAQRIFRNNPWGLPAALAVTWGTGALVVGSFLFASLGLYFDLWDFGPYAGSDWQLNSGIPGLHFVRSRAADTLAILLFLLYPVWFLIGVTLSERFVVDHPPSIREPIDLGPGRSAIAVADTHLGLAPNSVSRALGRGSEACPIVVQQFLRWLAKNPLGSVPVWNPVTKQVNSLPLKPPEYLVMCGDIIELWDAPDESVTLAMSQFFPALQRLDMESVLVVGNHDDVLRRDMTDGAAGPGHLRISPEVWPGPARGDPLDPMGRGIRPMRAGERQYIFLHGHQFDLGYQAIGPFYLAPGHLRRAARFGHYGWLFGIPLAFVLALLILGGAPSATWLSTIVAGSLLLLFFPIIYMKAGRRIFRAIGGGRYDAERSRKGFLQWWKTRAGGGRWRHGIAAGHEDMTVVFGHTHMADLFDPGLPRPSAAARAQRFPHNLIAAIKRLVPRPAGVPAASTGLPTLLNLPSWIQDPGRDQERAVFLYVDEEGHRIFGWDWTAQKPFHIPDRLLVERRKEVRDPFVTELYNAGMTFDDLRQLDWPVDFQDKWSRFEVGGI